MKFAAVFSLCAVLVGSCITASTPYPVTESIDVTSLEVHDGLPTRVGFVVHNNSPRSICIDEALFVRPHTWMFDPQLRDATGRPFDRTDIGYNAELPLPRVRVLPGQSRSGLLSTSGFFVPRAGARTPYEISLHVLGVYCDEDRVWSGRSDFVLTSRWIQLPPAT